jgi:anaerobic glycerol-3-phosphate dehydrogenase
MIFGLPINMPTDSSGWFRREFLHPQGHPIFSAGISVDRDFQPQASGKRIYENLYAAGIGLAGCDAIRERSLEGVALVTGRLAGLKAARSSRPEAVES